MTLFIGLCGKMGSGKDYITNNYIIPVLKKLHKNSLQISFADHLKINVMSKYNLSFEECFIKKTDISRSILQKEGTELGRNTENDKIWINYLDKWSQLHSSRGIDTFIISDVRFKNEIDYIKNEKNGIIIKIDAPKRNHSRLLQESNGDIDIYNKLKTHPSECDLDDLPIETFDLVINNDNYIDINSLFSIIYNFICHKKISQNKKNNIFY